VFLENLNANTMKKAMIAFGCCLLVLISRSQQIQDISVKADRPTYNGACPAKITFTATIHYSGSGTVQYTWLRSDGAHGPTRSMTLKGGGTQTINTTWQLGKSYSGWQAVKVLSPVAYESPHATFELACNGSAPAEASPAGAVVGRNKPALQVKNVQVAVNKPSFTGKCPVALSFSATVHYSGSGTIRYTWVNSDGGSNGTLSKQLSGTGTDQLLPHVWQLGRSLSGSATLKIISPVQYQSTPVNFQVNCGASAGARGAGGK
jgi:hypothetical protein